MKMSKNGYIRIVVLSIFFVYWFLNLIGMGYCFDPFSDWLPQEVVPEASSETPQFISRGPNRAEITREFLSKEIKINGLVWHTPMPQAIINGEVYKKGDEFEGAEIVAIDKEGVTFLYKGIEIIVRISRNFKEE